ncbi:MAG: Glutamate-tRNA ligase 1 [Candidatus Yanofskybacteria bacterium GW2011_GWC2_37_9]|uniref:Glutamate--tRNA ligase n=1 Tax=Candidatus Yanofskybacteria bacterium GW2011_GWC2_37_9 TaxID=1619028 RepID=A0A0G0HUH7_9BACT|nr:MAG: Glutamate-tRNA ligase 1 [Candidatus Yanofskybacteria bacterium GW2011_GWC2_37_9]
MDKKIVTRFAPSPTGHFHLGGVRSALYNYLFAKQNKGVYILRSEDTDKERSKKEYEDGFLELFNWLGLKPDQFFRQSERTEIYKKYLEKMIEDGFAYVSKEEIKEEGQRSEVIRFKNPNKKITFRDIVLGDITFDTTDLKDFIIARSLTEPLYHLTVVVDDFEMAVTHIIRGQEHIANTPRQILIQEAIGAQRPFYAHIPLILGKDRAKLSKRDPEVIPALEYKNLGYLPEAIINFMALIGWNPGGEQEVFTLDELVEKFDMQKIQKSGGIFNSEKLDWLNKEHMKKLSNDEVKNKILSSLSEEFQNEKIVPIIFERISKWNDIKNMERAGELDFFSKIKKPQYDKEKLVYKSSSAKETENNLKLAIKTLSDLNEENFTSDNIKISLMKIANGLKNRGELLHPVRYALSGKDKSPDPFIIAEILGKNETLSRLQKAV